MKLVLVDDDGMSYEVLEDTDDVFGSPIMSEQDLIEDIRMEIERIERDQGSDAPNTPLGV